jgi:ATP-dependent Clp protease adaptor protein ClpS
MNETEIDELIDKLLVETSSKKLILYNDDDNTFQKVIICLKHYCSHSDLQAEQCALITHHKGKCCVKEGVFDDLLPICTALLDKGLNATIE